MLKCMAARLALLASILALSACSLAGPAPRTFTPAAPVTAAAPVAAKPPPTTIETAASACKTETRNKGIKSVLAIVSFMRPGAVDAAYVQCMKAKGYDVAK